MPLMNCVVAVQLWYDEYEEYDDDRYNADNDIFAADAPNATGSLSLI